GLAERGFLAAEPRHQLAAEDAAVVAEEHHDGGAVGPQEAQANLLAVGVRQADAGQPLGQRQRHRATSTRVSLKQAPPEISAWWPGTRAETVWPLSLVRSHVPFQVETTPAGTASVISSGRWTSPRSFQTRTVVPGASPRARASSGCISSAGVSSLVPEPPKVDVMRRSEAGEIRSSG